MILLIIILVMLGVVLAIALAVSLRESGGDDASFRDKDGDHVYYDQSLIEKKRFRSLHPKEAVRTFARLFGKK